MVERLFLAVPWGCLLFVIVVFPDHTRLLFLNEKGIKAKGLRKDYVRNAMKLKLEVILCQCK